MVSRIQVQVAGQLAENGWVSVSAPYSEKSPVGGPTMMINDVHDVCWVMADGKMFTMTIAEQTAFRDSKEGEIVYDEGGNPVTETPKPTPPPSRTLKESDVLEPPVMLGLDECLVVLQSHKSVKKNPTAVAVLQQIQRELQVDIPNKNDIKTLWDIAKPALAAKNIATILSRTETLLFP